MPSVSKAQQRFMGLVHAYKKGEVPASKVSQAVKDAAKSMKKKSTKKFASTKHDDLPNKVRSENMNEDVFAIVDKYDDRKQDYDQVYFKDNNLNKVKKQMKKMGRKYGKMNLIRVKSNGKMSVVENLKEDGHTDVASAERKLKLIMKDAMDTLNALRNLSNEDSLPSWWTDKITLAKDYVGKSRDYIMNPAESVDESVNETPQKVAKLLIKYGNNTKDVKDMIKKHYKTAKKDRSKSTPSELANYISFLSANESVNEGKGVEKILKMADEKSFGKIAGRTVDGMTSGLFKAVYDKAPQNAKDKIDKMSEKQLYVFMGKLWNKFGRQVKLS